MQIFDTQFAHAVSAGTPYDNTILPFEWERKPFLLDLDKFIVFTESAYETSKTIISDKKILWVLESPFMVPEYLIQDIIKNHNIFHTILTHDDRLIHLPNVKKFPIGGCWIFPDNCAIYDKEPLSVSTVLSQKIWTEGHALRHQIPVIRKELKKSPKIEIYGHGYSPLNYKLLALEKYQFHICIENIKNNSYFTEKIIDCFATGTIPIYYGCNKISETFNTNGIIEIDDINELKFCLENLDKFEIDQEAIKENYEISKEYWLPEDRINKLFLQDQAL